MRTVFIITGEVPHLMSVACEQQYTLTQTILTNNTRAHKKNKTLQLAKLDIKFCCEFEQGKWYKA